MDRKELYRTLNEKHTKEYQDKFDSSHVAIAGLGGLGSNIAIFLARVGIGNIHLIDFDKVDVSNIHRQQYYISDIGRLKTEVMKERLLQINPYINIRTTNIVVTKENMADIFKDADIICEAFDKPENKSMLVNEFFENFGSEKKLVSGNGMAGFGDSNEIKTKKITDNFYMCGDFKTDVGVAKTLTAARVAVCAAHEANMVVRLIIEQK